MQKWSLTWQLYSIFDKKGQKREQAFATYGIVGFIEPDDVVSGESLFLFLAFFIKYTI